MAYDLPTSADFIDRFPEFYDEDTDRIDALIAEAARQVDSSWIEEDYQRAIMYLAAHYLSSDISNESSAGVGNISSESIGRISVSYRGPSSVNEESLRSTAYGVRFVELRKLNHPGVIIV